MTVTIDYVLPEWVKAGASFNLNANLGTRKSRKLHVRAIVDDRAVLREWWHGRGWEYSIEGPGFFLAFQEKITNVSLSEDGP